MILSGKNLKNAVSEEGITGLEKKKKMHFPVLKCHFDVGNSLFCDKKDEKPLYSCNMKGDFKLPIIEFLASVALGFAALSLLCAILKKKFSKKN